MDRLFFEIKNFLRKLEMGQLKIEQGQWEMCKDISTLKKSFEQFQRLKLEVEELRLHIESIRQLEKKFNTCKSLVTKKQSGNSSNFSKRDPSTWGSFCSKSVKSEACSCNRWTTPPKSCNSWEEKERESSSDEDPQSSEMNDSSASTWTCVKNNRMKKKLSARPYVLCAHPNGNGSLMHRYLKDTNDFVGQSSCSESNSEISNTDDTSYDRQSSERNIEKTVSSHSSISLISSNALVCQSFSNKVGDEKEASNHGKCVKLRYSCSNCDKNFPTKDSLKSHKATHKTPSRNTSYRCGYCKEGCKTLKNLTRHLRNCRNILRSHFSNPDV